jgi:hypothetical protein
MLVVLAVLEMQILEVLVAQGLLELLEVLEPPDQLALQLLH